MEGSESSDEEFELVNNINYVTRAVNEMEKMVLNDSLAQQSGSIISKKKMCP